MSLTKDLVFAHRPLDHVWLRKVTSNNMHNFKCGWQFFNIMVSNCVFLSRLYKYEKKLNNDVKKRAMPSHVAIILDGNRRWAKRYGVISKKGHEVGADAVKRLLCWCKDLDIKILTLYVLSSENLDRSPKEIEELYDILTRLKILQNDPKIHEFGI